MDYAAAETAAPMAVASPYLDSPATIQNRTRVSKVQENPISNVPDLTRPMLVSLSCNISNRELPFVFSKIAGAKIGEKSETTKCFLTFSYHELHLIQLQTTIAIKKNCRFKKKPYFCSRKSIGEQSSSDVHNLAMTCRASQPVDFFFYAVMAVIQYCIFSSDRLIPFVLRYAIERATGSFFILTVPIPTSS